MKDCENCEKNPIECEQQTCACHNFGVAKSSPEKKGWREELLRMLNDPRTGLRDSSDTNKTRMGILGLFESIIKDAIREERKRVLKEIDSLRITNPHLEDNLCSGHNLALDKAKQTVFPKSEE